MRQNETIHAEYNSALCNNAQKWKCKGKLYNARNNCKSNMQLGVVRCRGEKQKLVNINESSSTLHHIACANKEGY